MFKKKEDKSVDTSAYRQTEFSWETSRLAMVNASEAKAWRIVKIMSFCLIALCLALITVYPLKTVEPYVIQVDKSTGMTEILHIANEQDIPVDEMMNKYWVSQYVLARETYDWRTLNQEYIKTRELSLPNVFESYASQFGDSKDSLETKLKDNMRIITRLTSVVINSESIATVRFTKRAIDNKTGLVKAENYWTATIGFEYFPTYEANEENRIINPFGFKVTSYRVDPELTK